MIGANALQPVGLVPGGERQDRLDTQWEASGPGRTGMVRGSAGARVAMPAMLPASALEVEEAEEVDQVARAAAFAASLLKPPPPALREVDRRTAERAWGSVMDVLSGAFRAAKAASKHDEKAVQLALSDLGGATESMHAFYRRALNPEAVLMELQVESGIFTAELMKANLDHTLALRKEEMAAIEEKQRKEQEAAEKQKQMQQKAGKGQVLGLVLNWAMAAAQVVTGALKIATGQPQGAIDLAAGLVGLAKCTLQTIEMAHPELAGKLRHHIDELAKWEMGLSVVAGLASVVSVARIAKAANAILGTAAGELLTTGVEQGGKRISSVGVTLVNAMEKGGDAAEAASQLVKNIAQTMVDDVAVQLRNSLRVAGGSQKLAEAFARSFTNEAVQKLVEQSLWQAAKQMRGLTTEVIQSTFIDQVKKQLTLATVRAAVNFTAALEAASATARVVAPAAQQITVNALRVEGANKKEEIERMMIHAMMLQFLIDLIGRQIKENRNALERVTQDHIDNTENITNAIGEIRDVALQAVTAGV
ncbi:type III secretion system translocon subunit SctE [Cupriavidus sp. DB3]|uniref:type III secretion system translocon subunit SctE n=1 Tax=Cupriavidus sp. DB3 TaxID=2873259 RepID=UPI00351D5BC1